MEKLGLCDIQASLLIMHTRQSMCVTFSHISLNCFFHIYPNICSPSKCHREVFSKVSFFFDWGVPSRRAPDFAVILYYSTYTSEKTRVGTRSINFTQKFSDWCTFSCTSNIVQDRGLQEEINIFSKQKQKKSEAPMPACHFNTWI